ncbi:MAG TPA: hypothetical protein VIS56_01370 [Candidatus Saccharimonadales bacterium]
MAETEIKVGGGGKKSRKSWWLVAFFSVGAIALAGAAGVGLRWLASLHDKKTEKPLIEQVQELRLSGSPEETNKKIVDALGKTSTSDADRYMLYIQQGSNYEDQQKLPEAVESYKKASGVKETYEVVSLIADAYRRIGDKEAAITYYKKAILLMSKDGNPLYSEDKAALESTIKTLGGQP